VLLETMLYLNSLQAALVIYPLTFRGATEHRASVRRLATASLILTCALMPVLGAATIASTGALHSPQLALAAVTGMFLWQLQETLRRALMADLRFREPIWGDVVRYLGHAGAIFVLARMDALDLNRALIFMGITSAIAIGIQAFQVGLAPIRMSELKLVTADFWRLGRWMLLCNAGNLISGLGYWWVLKWRWGLDACAVFAAIAALFKLANPLMSSITGLIVPAVARAVAQADAKAATRMAVRYIALGAAMLMPYFFVLAVFPAQLLRVFYGANSPYVQEAMLLRLFVGNYTACYLLATIGGWLSALGRTRYNFYTQVVNIIVTLLVGLPLTARWGVAGLIIGGLIAASTSAVATAYFIHKIEQLPAPPQPPPPEPVIAAATTEPHPPGAV
jgi:O-antigen/teichoic acid export membrane protein